MTRPRERIAIVVLSFNKRPDTLACLESVMRLEEPPSEIVVVDNGSRDGSADAVAGAFPRVHLIRSGVNLGASGGRNAGWRYATERLGANYVLFLDNDTVLHPAFLSELHRALQADPSAGIAFGKGYTRFPSTTIMSAGITVNRYTGAIRDRGAGRTDDGRYDRPTYTDACPGFGFLVRRAVLEQTEGLDERFNPYGWEDVDFSLRASTLGHRILYVPGAVIYHNGGKAGRPPLFLYERQKVRNYLLLLSRHTTILQRLTCAACFPFRALIVIGGLIVRGHAAMLAAHLQGLREGVRTLSHVSPAPDFRPDNQRRPS